MVIPMVTIRLAEWSTRGAAADTREATDGGSELIKYLGSKRTLIPEILAAVRAVPGARTVVDLFSGTSRVGHALKAAGYRVLANDHNAYAATLARCYVQADAEDVLEDAERLVREFNRMKVASGGSAGKAPSGLGDSATPPAGGGGGRGGGGRGGGGRGGYFTETFCRRSRYFQAHNGERIDAIREAIARKELEPELEAVMLVSLMEAADRVDSTTGLQMAYLKEWAPRSYKELELRVPRVLGRARHGKGEAHCLDALEAAERLEGEVVYIDPPYNQHSYLGNYHVWETLVRWDKPEVYGVACKRVDCRERRSEFNSRARFAGAMRGLLERVATGGARGDGPRALVVSFSNEGYMAREEMEERLGSLWEREGGARVRTIERDYKRYVGAQIGIYNPAGEKVGKVSHLRNKEYVYVVGRGRGQMAKSNGQIAQRRGLVTASSARCG
jgi:adenine-specific DNA-methyltransferase